LILKGGKKVEAPGKSVVGNPGEATLRSQKRGFLKGTRVHARKNDCRQAWCGEVHEGEHKERHVLMTVFESAEAESQVYLLDGVGL